MNHSRATDLASRYTTVVGRALMQKVVAQYTADGLKVRVYDVRGENSYRVVGRLAELKGGAA